MATIFHCLSCLMLAPHAVNAPYCRKCSAVKTNLRQVRSLVSRSRALRDVAALEECVAAMRTYATYLSKTYGESYDNQRDVDLLNLSAAKAYGRLSKLLVTAMLTSKIVDAEIADAHAASHR